MLPWKNWWFIGHFRSSSKPWSCLFPYKPVSSPFRLTLSFGSQRERLPSPKKTTRVTNIPITHFEQVSFRHEVFPWVIAKMNMFMVPDILSQWILETFFLVAILQLREPSFFLSILSYREVQDFISRTQTSLND